MFGHRDASEEIIPALEKAIEEHYERYGIRTFVVGRYGKFDLMASEAVKRFTQTHPDAELVRLLAYLPGKSAPGLPFECSATLYPPIEKTPKQFAIVEANRYMVRNSDTLICCVSHMGNTRKLLEYARALKNGRIRAICNVAFGGAQK